MYPINPKWHKPHLASSFAMHSTNEFWLVTGLQIYKANHCLILLMWSLLMALCWKLQKFYFTRFVNSVVNIRTALWSWLPQQNAQNKMQLDKMIMWTDSGSTAKSVASYSGSNSIRYEQIIYWKYFTTQFYKQKLLYTILSSSVMPYFQALLTQVLL